MISPDELLYIWGASGVSLLKMETVGLVLQTGMRRFLTQGETQEAALYAFIYSRETFPTKFSPKLFFSSFFTKSTYRLEAILCCPQPDLSV